jgi:hypothetical protein
MLYGRARRVANAPLRLPSPLNDIAPDPEIFRELSNDELSHLVALDFALDKTNPSSASDTLIDYDTAMRARVGNPQGPFHLEPLLRVVGARDVTPPRQWQYFNMLVCDMISCSWNELNGTPLRSAMGTLRALSSQLGWQITELSFQKAIQRAVRKHGMFIRNDDHTDRIRAYDEWQQLVPQIYSAVTLKYVSSVIYRHQSEFIPLTTVNEPDSSITKGRVKPKHTKLVAEYVISWLQSDSLQLSASLRDGIRQELQRYTKP